MLTSRDVLIRISLSHLNKTVEHDLLSMGRPAEYDYTVINDDETYASKQKRSTNLKSPTTCWYPKENQVFSSDIKPVWSVIKMQSRAEPGCFTGFYNALWLAEEGGSHFKRMLNLAGAGGSGVVAKWWLEPYPNLHQWCLQVSGLKRLACHGDHYAIRRCHNRGESEDHTSEKACINSKIPHSFQKQLSSYKSIHGCLLASIFWLPFIILSTLQMSFSPCKSKGWGRVMI